MKIIRTEVLKTEGRMIPEITGVYDLLTGQRDGTITPMAPIEVTGCHLYMEASSGLKLCLTPATCYVRIIDIPSIHTCSAGRIVINLPPLEPGEYFPAMLIENAEEESSLYILPVSWVVKERTEYCSWKNGK